MVINIDENMNFQMLNKRIRDAVDKETVLNGCIGQRYIGTGASDKKIVINGTPGNALGAYLNGGEIYVYANAQDATGDTMNSGTIVIHGNAGDATGYAMHGGKIYLRCKSLPHRIPSQVRAEKLCGNKDTELIGIIYDYCKYFDDMNADHLLDADYFVLTPNSENPYKRMYTDN